MLFQVGIRFLCGDDESFQIETDEILSKRIEEIFNFIDEDSSSRVSLCCGCACACLDALLELRLLWYATLCCLDCPACRWISKSCGWG